MPCSASPLRITALTVERIAACSVSPDNRRIGGLHASWLAQAIVAQHLVAQQQIIGQLFEDSISLIDADSVVP
jgi:hypothetical protein